MSTTAASVIPGPTAEQVSALSAGLDPSQPTSFETFGAEAQAAAAAACEPLAGNGAGLTSQDARACLEGAAATAGALNPAALTPRRGLAGLFDSRGGRLKRVREAFVGTDRRLAEAGEQLKTQAGAFKARMAALETGHEAARQPIIDLGAWIEAGRSRLAEAVGDAEEGQASPRDQLAGRLEALAGSRMSALAHLPVARALQNADAVTADRLEAAAGAIDKWREDWRKALGLEGKRRRKVQPEPTELSGLTARLDRALSGAGQALTAADERRRLATERLASLRQSVAPPTASE